MLMRMEIQGFKSFPRKTTLVFDSPISAIVGPNGSGKSNVAEALRWVLGEQSIKSIRGKRGEDLIWNGTPHAPAASRASVTVYFDNRKKIFPLDFDEISIMREVHRDGTNGYFVNGSHVRLKDIVELLASIGLGASSRHIVSQGEADRALLISPVERAEMIEEALSLNLYKFKLLEAEKKLEKTNENIEKVASLRRELAPHLKFLAKQVEKAHKIEELRKEASLLAAEHLAHKKYSLTKKEDEVRKNREALRMRNDAIASEGADKPEYNDDSLRLLESRHSRLISARNEMTRELASLSHEISSLRAKAERVKWDVDMELARCAMCNQTLSEGVKNKHAEESASILEKISEAETRLALVSNDEKALIGELSKIESEIGEERLNYKQKIASHYESNAERERIERDLRELSLNESRYQREKTDFETMVRNAIELLGREAIKFESIQLKDDDIASIGEEQLLERASKLNRLFIRLEDAGGIGSEHEFEYKKLVERDAHFDSEIRDLVSAKESLSTLSQNLTATLESEFSAGISKINTEFGKFFAIVFGGGTASLTPREYEFSDGKKVGLDLSVMIPGKKVKSITMLSGGEKTLAAIALLFALSRVNPPPFMVLDETDAALDEANSHRYATMLSELSKQVKLVVVTHNRETMAQAAVLYGVTIGRDGGSKLLSVRFEEAAEHASR